MYYHKGKNYKVGETISKFSGIFGKVEVTFQEDFDFDLKPEQFVSAFAVDKKCSGKGQSVESAIADLYQKLASFEALKDAEISITS